MSSGVGIDSGTFHTVATHTNGSSIRIPTRSIQSIALLRLGKNPIVGIHAVPQMDLPLELILAPKLSLGKASVNDPILQTILRQLAQQALEDLGGKPSNTVLTVPPGWTFEHCQILQKAVEPIGGMKVQFIHEPIALLIAAMHLAPRYTKDPRLVAKLENADLVLVCDWGAGTVDIALVQITRCGHQHEFSCIGELTELGQGGTSMAKDIISQYAEDEGTSANIDNKMVFRLQCHWQGDHHAAQDFSCYDLITQQRRQQAADTISKKIEELFSTLKIQNRTEILCMLYGGPLESLDLRSFLEKDLIETLGFLPKQFIHIDNDFAESLPFDKVRWRRDVFVATGASLFAARGKALPEFEYEITLKDSSGHSSSSVRLARRHNLAGIQVITPPFSGVDYYVDVQQLRRDGTKTSIKTELSLHIRKDAVVMYRIREAGVGYALVEAIESQNLHCPEPFLDACLDQRTLPEQSTRFSINLE